MAYQVAGRYQRYQRYQRRTEVAAYAIPLRRGRPQTAAAGRRVAKRPSWAVSTLLIWSATYLARQPGLDGRGPFSPVGDFALEGIALSLCWLAALVAICLAALSGAVAFKD